jgi:PAS domain S-box-containing protein
MEIWQGKSMDKARVLVVEDEGIVSRDLEQNLRLMGYEVAGVVDSGEKAVSMALETKPDLVLMDIVLKGRMDGVEAAGEIRRRVDIPIIYLTAYADEPTLERAKLTEPFGYLLKPFQEREVHSTIEVALYRHGVGKKLRERERWFSTTLKALREGVITAGPDGRITFLNTVAERLTGWPQEETQGRFPQEVLRIACGEDGGNGEDELEEGFRGEKDAGMVAEAILKGRDGLYNPVEISWAPIRDERNSVLGTVWVLHDLKERKRIEKEKRELQEQLLHAQKLEAIGRLAGGIAHDFNNAITVIRVCSELSLMELKEGDPLREKTQTIFEATQKSADLTKQLLAFSSSQVMEPKVLDLNQILGNLEKMLRRIIGEDIELKILPAEDLGRVKADPGQIEQVVINLVVNARDAMPRGGKLTLETANVELDDEHARNHTGTAPGHYVMISVTDSGMGMTPEVRERVFEPFFTTKEPGKGTGLGLATVYGIVKQSGGSIGLYSEVGAGTTFRIYLPRVKEPLTKAPMEMTGEIPRGKEIILLVEDDQRVRKLAAEILSRQGYQVLEASNGGEALLLCEQQERLIHLMLTDLLMPVMSGPELAQRLTPLRPGMKVLYMSGYADNLLSTEGLMDSDVNFIQKPFTVEGLSRKVREVLDASGNAGKR